MELACARSLLSCDTLNVLYAKLVFFLLLLFLSCFFGFNFPSPPPLQLVILQVAAASLEPPPLQTGSGGHLPPSTHPPLPASQAACDIFSRLPCGIFCTFDGAAARNRSAVFLCIPAAAARLFGILLPRVQTLVCCLVLFCVREAQTLVVLLVFSPFKGFS